MYLVAVVLLLGVLPVLSILAELFAFHTVAGAIYYGLAGI